MPIKGSFQQTRSRASLSQPHASQVRRHPCSSPPRPGRLTSQQLTAFEHSRSRSNKKAQAGKADAKAAAKAAKKLAQSKKQDKKLDKAAAKTTGKTGKGSGQPGKGKGKADEDDLEAILESFQREWEVKHAVSEEVADGPPSRRANATLVACPTGNYLWCIGGEYFDGDRA